MKLFTALIFASLSALAYSATPLFEILEEIDCHENHALRCWRIDINFNVFEMGDDLFIPIANSTVVLANEDHDVNSSENDKSDSEGDDNSSGDDDRSGHADSDDGDDVFEYTVSLTYSIRAHL